MCGLSLYQHSTNRLLRLWEGWLLNKIWLDRTPCCPRRKELLKRIWLYYLFGCIQRRFSKRWWTIECGYIIIYYTIQVGEKKTKEVEASGNICLQALRKSWCLVFWEARKINRMCSFSKRSISSQTCFYRFPYGLTWKVGWWFHSYILI